MNKKDIDLKKLVLKILYIIICKKVETYINDSARLY